MYAFIFNPAFLLTVTPGKKWSKSPRMSFLQAEVTTSSLCPLCALHSLSTPSTASPPSCEGNTRARLIHLHSRWPDRGFLSSLYLKAPPLKPSIFPFRSGLLSMLTGKVSRSVFALFLDIPCWNLGSLKS